MQRYDSSEIKSENRYRIPKLVLASLALLCLIALALTADSHAASTQVNTSVCNGSQVISKSLQILEPASDSIVRSEEVTVRGSVENVGQIEVYLNGAFDHALSLPAGAKSFSTAVRLAPGTATIKVIGYQYGECRIQPMEDTVVITYQPPLKPAPGAPGKQSSGSTAAAGTSGAKTFFGDGVEPRSADQGGLPGLANLSPLTPAAVSLGFDSFLRPNSVVSSIMFVAGLVAIAGAIFFKKLPSIYSRIALVAGITLLILALFVG